MQTISVGIFDDHPLIVQGMRQLFGSAAGYDVVVSGTSVEEAVATIGTIRCDVIILDLRMPGDVISAIPTFVGHAKVIVFTAGTDAVVSIACLDAGACGFVVKDCAIDEILLATDQVASGDIYVSSRLAARMITHLRHRAAAMAHVNLHLSIREEQVAHLVATAKSNRDIAKLLDISEKTVRTHMTALMMKMHARNRVEVATKFKTITNS